jgi:hypothetical protein
VKQVKNIGQQEETSASFFTIIKIGQQTSNKEVHEHVSIIIIIIIIRRIFF